MKRIPLAATLALTVACGSPPADPDSGIEVPDAGPIDAPVEPDAGPPSPLQLANEDAEMRIDTITSMRDAVPPAMRLTAPWMELDVLVGRLDAIIGEDSLVAGAGIIGEDSLTASLTPQASIILVVLRHLAIAEPALMGLHEVWSSSPVPAEQGIATELLSLHTTVLEMQMRLAGRFRVLADPDLASGTLETAYRDDRVVELTPAGTVMTTVLDGNGTAQPFINVDCSGRPFNLIILDPENPGVDPLPLQLAMTGMFGGNFTIRDADVNVYQIVMTTGDTSPAWSTCQVSVQGQRRTRGPLVSVTPTDSIALDREETSFQSSAGPGALQMDIMQVRGAGTPDEIQMADLIETLATETAVHAGVWRQFTSASGAIWADDLEAVRANELALRAALTALRASPALPSARVPNLANHLMGIQAANTAGTALLEP
jgi:hypothetical protein